MDRKKCGATGLNLSCEENCSGGAVELDIIWDFCTNNNKFCSFKKCKAEIGKPSTYEFTCGNCGGGDRGRVAIYRPFGEVSLSLNRTVTCMVLKANDRRTSCPCHDEFRGPRSDYVRQRKRQKSKVSTADIEAGLSAPWNGLVHRSQQHGIHQSTSCKLVCVVNISGHTDSIRFMHRKYNSVISGDRGDPSSGLTCPIQRLGYALSSQSRTGARS
ncbi:uncharacterized protein TNCV_743651 [Trichonephila clavipes]|nr:uncharacterized protein TNCV_743651 [Trichonephila clavipes]